ncbi:MAG: hypothetical protein U5K75_02200 [Ahrensia sp.]|nr:hypothetical protein [Ahrensia sp.]
MSSFDYRAKNMTTLLTFETYGLPMMCYSVSARDGGVRKKEIVIEQERWELMNIHWPVGDLEAIFKAQRRRKI